MLSWFWVKTTHFIVESLDLAIVYILVDEVRLINYWAPIHRLIFVWFLRLDFFDLFLHLSNLLLKLFVSEEFAAKCDAKVCVYTYIGLFLFFRVFPLELSFNRWGPVFLDLVRTSLRHSHPVNFFRRGEVRTVLEIFLHVDSQAVVNHLHWSALRYFASLSWLWSWLIFLGPWTGRWLLELCFSNSLRLRKAVQGRCRCRVVIFVEL